MKMTITIKSSLYDDTDSMALVAPVRDAGDNDKVCQKS